MVLHQGTSLAVSNGTTLHIEAPVSFTVEAGSYMVNDGRIVFGPQAELDEQAGAPITGAGTEITSRLYSAPLTFTEPAGLGFSFTTALAPDSFIVERGHLPRINNLAVESIARWYRVRSGAVQALGASGVLFFDLTELNGIPEAALRMARSGTGGTWWPELGSTIDLGAHTATATLPDSLGWFTLFDDAVISDVAVLVGRDGFHLFPTVATGTVTVHGATRIGPFQVFDARGRIVYSGSASTTNAVIDISMLSPGAYAVLVNGTHQLRFVKP
ncbi:MAG: T9SS type A sorting domain-containing protein [Flavobacteriales bacterium]